MGFKLNRQQMEADESGRLPEPGEYTFQVTSAEEKASVKSSDGKMILLKLLIRTEAGQVETVKDVLGQWKNGAKKLLSFLDAVGVDADSEFSVKDLINKRGTVAVKHGEFNNRPQLEVDYYVPLVSGVSFSDLEPISDDDVPF